MEVTHTHTHSHSRHTHARTHQQAYKRTHFNTHAQEYIRKKRDRFISNCSIYGKKNSEYVQKQLTFFFLSLIQITMPSREVACNYQVDAVVGPPYGFVKIDTYTHTQHHALTLLRTHSILISDVIFPRCQLSCMREGIFGPCMEIHQIA